MPLPKTASIAARATEVYTEVCSVIMDACYNSQPYAETSDSPNAKLKDVDEQTELSELLPYLRQLLTCCACAGLLEEAMVSLSCGHCYCYQCQFKQPLLKIQCRQCRERTGLVNENQLRMVVKCYKNVCLLLAHHQKRKKKESGEKEKPVGKPVLPSSGLGTSCASNPDDVEKFDPVYYILREVTEGTKVPRAVLMVRPPSKYINVKNFSSGHHGSPSARKDTAKVAPNSAVSDNVDLENSSDKADDCEPSVVQKAHGGKKAAPGALTGKGRSCGSSGVTAGSHSMPIRILFPHSQTGDLEVEANCLDEKFVTVTSQCVSVKGTASSSYSSPANNAGMRRSIVSDGDADLPKKLDSVKRPPWPLSPRLATGSKKQKLEKPKLPSSVRSEEGKTALSQSTSPKRGSSHKHAGCRCGTNNPVSLDKICAYPKCPCFQKGASCRNCRCRHCNNPFQD